mgnify:CR=1 FL=1
MNLIEQEARDMVGEGREPENPVVETEAREHLTRIERKDGAIEWREKALALSDIEQDRFEEAYDMGYEAGMKDAKARAQGYDQGFQAGYMKACDDMKDYLDREYGNEERKD